MTEFIISETDDGFEYPSYKDPGDILVRVGDPNVPKTWEVLDYDSGSSCFYMDELGFRYLFEEYWSDLFEAHPPGVYVIEGDRRALISEATVGRPMTMLSSIPAPFVRRPMTKSGARALDPLSIRRTTMTMRKITTEQANAAYDILVREAGANGDHGERYSFVYHVSQSPRPTNEYRFGGKLGFGGKFRNNGNNDGIPYVDCYREHLTPEVQAVIATTNAALLALFSPGEDKE